MSRKKSKKTLIFGMPMNWDSKNILKALWNPKSNDLFPPKSYGIGWTVNFHAVLRKAGLIKKRKLETTRK